MAIHVFPGCTALYTQLVPWLGSARESRSLRCARVSQPTLLRDRFFAKIDHGELERRNALNDGASKPRKRSRSSTGSASLNTTPVRWTRCAFVSVKAMKPRHVEPSRKENRRATHSAPLNENRRSATVVGDSAVGATGESSRSYRCSVGCARTSSRQVSKGGSRRSVSQ